MGKKLTRVDTGLGTERIVLTDREERDGYTLEDGVVKDQHGKVVTDRSVTLTERKRKVSRSAAQFGVYQGTMIKFSHENEALCKSFAHNLQVELVKHGQDVRTPEFAIEVKAIPSDEENEVIVAKATPELAEVKVA